MLTDFAAPPSPVPSPALSGQPPSVVGVRVFIHGPAGGNPVPLVADAAALTSAQMQQVAQQYGHESAFVCPPTSPGADWRLRFFVPRHEMEMCGHATVGTLWALRQWGRWTAATARIDTLSGPVDARWDEGRQQVEVSQPAVQVQALPAEHRQQVARALRLPPELAAVAMVNAATSRVKTLVQLPSARLLDGLQPDFAAMEQVCEAIGSTGLYPYALDTEAATTVYARQFPKSSGYPEDAATGIAAAALWGYLAQASLLPAGSADQPAICTVRQGDAMGCPSAIQVRARFGPGGMAEGCWLSGQAAWSPL